MASLAHLSQRRAGWRGGPDVRTLTVSQCVCGANVVAARTVTGDDVVLDADRKGAPRVVAGGAFVEVAAEADVLGRRPLVVQAVGPALGQYRLHGLKCTGPARREP